MCSSTADDHACGHGHVVGFYDTDESLVTMVAGFVADGLAAGDAVLVVATAEHRTAVATGAITAGVDVRAEIEAGRLIVLDAAATLARFMVDGAPDAERFEQVIGAAIDRAAQGGQAVRVFGEMVALLWAAGDEASTVALERLWNDLGRTRTFSLLCGYPLGGFAAAPPSAFREICDLHGDVVPAADFPVSGGPEAQRRAVAELQQEMQSLRAELDLLRRRVGHDQGAPSEPWDVTRAVQARPQPFERGRRRAADDRLVSLRDAYHDAILAGDGAPAERIVREAMGIAEPAEVYVEVIAAAMERIGDSWETGAVTVAQEHVATAVTGRVLGAVFDLVLRARPHAGARVLLAAPEGEQHVLGLRMAADLLEGAGHEVVFVGADVPTDALVAMLRDTAPAGLGLTISEHVDPVVVTDIVARARTLDPKVTVFVGGAGAAAGVWDPDVLIVDDVRTLDAVSEALASDQRTVTSRAEASTSRPGAPISAQRDPAADPVDLLLRSTMESAEMVRGHVRQANALRRAALQDPVTGGWNRRALDDHLRQASAAPSQRPLAVLTIDLDDFKSVNDERGHAAGDDLLRAVDATIQETLRPGDFVARMGGDEFCVVLAHTGLEPARLIGERIRDALNADPATQVASVSVGAAQHEGDMRATMARADGAMYEAKRAGGDAVRVAAAA